MRNSIIAFAGFYNRFCPDFGVQKDLLRLGDEPIRGRLSGPESCDGYCEPDNDAGSDFRCNTE